MLEKKRGNENIDWAWKPPFEFLDLKKSLG